jgi:hypothetical protein
MKNDPTLCKIVHTEDHGRYHVQAMLSRFGNLLVGIFDHQAEENAPYLIWQGHNILEARATVASIAQAVEALEAAAAYSPGGK